MEFLKKLKSLFTGKKEPVKEEAPPPAAGTRQKKACGAPRRIRRKCKECGNFFSFPSTIAHYPSYCPNCRKRHQAAQKEKYARKGANGQ